jgi:hypothetical protein
VLQMRRLATYLRVLLLSDLDATHE